MIVFRLALRALRWRAAASVAVFLVALTGVLAATAGPIYLHALDDTVLTERLSGTPANQLDTLITRSTLTVPHVTWSEDLRAVARSAADPRWYGSPVYESTVDMYLDADGRSATRLAALDATCAHVTITAGRCLADGSTGETIISARTATELDLTVGATIAPQPITDTAAVRLTVVGIYQPVDPSGAYWQPWGLFDARAGIGNQLAHIDSLLVTPEALSSRMNKLEEKLAALVPLRPTAVHLDDRPALLATVHAAQALAARRSQQATANYQDLTATTITTQLPTVLSRTATEMSLARTLVTVATAQLSLLAIVLLYAAVAGTTSAQGSEVALARLRGRRTRSVLAQGVLQPILLILAAAPIGAALAWLVVRLLDRSLLGRSEPVVFPPAAYAVAGLAALGGAVAAAVAARRTLVAPVSALLRRSVGDGRSSVALAIADGAAVTLALAGLVELLAGGVLSADSANPLSALAPALLAVAGAVLVLRLLPLAGRAVIRSTRETRRLAGYLAVRQIVRRPAEARAVLLVAVALAIAAFGVTNWSAAGTDRQQRAVNGLGAWKTLDVVPGPNVADLRTAVDRADPSGHSMAAAFTDPGQSTPMLAVDTARFDGIGAWLSGNAGRSLPAVLAAVAPVRPAPVAFTGTRLRLSTDVTKVPKYPVTLGLSVVDSEHTRTDLSAVRIPGGTSTHEIDVAQCASGCRIVAVALAADTPDVTQIGPDDGPAEVVATISVSALSGGGWKAVTGFGEPARWRSDGESGAQITAAGGALAVDLRQTTAGGGWATLNTAAVPDAVPAVFSSGTAALDRGDISQSSTTGLDGLALPIGGVLTSVTLPKLDRYGVLVDFATAESAMTRLAAATTHFQVWLAPGAPSDMDTRLAKLGIQVTGTNTAATERRELDRTGPAFADTLFLLAAIAAVLLAVAAVVLGGTVGARRRAYELAALESVGVPRRTLRRSVAIEQSVLVGLGLLVGLAAGIGGSYLALPSMPYFVDQTVGPPIGHATPWVLLAFVAVALIAVFAATCVALSRGITRRATVGRLREGAP
ncbi:MAG TPA: FtsX-like permease family protein [Micromonosporaceae bacterium]